MSVVVVAVLMLALALAVHLLLAYAKFRRLELAIPGPASLPLLGNALSVVGVTEDTVLSTMLDRLWGHRYGQLSRVSALGRLFVFVSDPDHLRELFRRRDLLDKDPFWYGFLSPVDKGLLSLNGAAWRAHRRALLPAFHQTVLDGYTAVFSAEALVFVRHLRPGGGEEQQDVVDSLESMVARAFLRTAIALDLLSSEAEQQQQSLLSDLNALACSVSQSFGYRSVQPWLWPDAVFGLTAAGRETRRLKARVDALCREAIRARRAQLLRERAEGGDTGADTAAKYRTLVDILLEPGDRHSLSDEEILDEFLILAGAAIDTSAATLGWVLKVLSLRQDVQQRLLQEVEEVLGKDAASHASTVHLDKLEYTERVLKETLRLLPAAPVFARGVPHETDFCGHTLPAGSTLIVNVLGAHRDPGHWPDPLRFDPDRFLPENSLSRHPYAYVPFSLGPRNCIGGRYAMMLMKTLLAMLVPRYRIDPVDDGYKEPADLPMAVGIASRMVGGLRVVFNPRSPGP